MQGMGLLSRPIRGYVKGYTDPPRSVLDLSPSFVGKLIALHVPNVRTYA